MTNLKEIQKVSNKIVKEFEPKKIVLFGSYAWGKPHQDSDVDLFIIKESRQRRIDRERKLRSLLIGNDFPPMDLLIYTPQEVKKRLAIKDFFIHDILTKGKVLYGREIF